MPRQVSPGRRTIRRWKFAPQTIAAIFVVAILMVGAPASIRAEDAILRAVPERSGTRSPAVPFLTSGALPTVRVFDNEDERFALSSATLRAIDDAPEIEPVTRFGSSRPRREPIAAETPAEMFSRSPGTDWVGELRPVDREMPLMSLREDGDVALIPVRRLSIPNPLKLIGNPFRWGGRFRAEYGTNFDDLDLLRGNLIVNSGLPIGFDTEFNYRNDDVRAHRHQDFWTGDFNLVYRFGRIRYAEIRAGVGMNWLASSGTTDFGFNATYGVDFHLRGPWVVSTTFDYGTLGSESLLHMQFTGGIEFDRFELYLGYDFYEVGSQEWKAVIGGIGMWF